MSNIYIQEPPTEGKVLLKTSVGDIEIELWSKETPKACRNFVQLCMEGYYNNTIIHRIVKGFIAQGGDPTGTGTGGDSIYGKPFKDELHSRLRFVRRGLVAMANAGKDDNGSQFFFTFAAAPELNGKHTIFGKVAGDTIYNMIKLEDILVDHDDRPVYDQKILKASVLHNPFPDIIPRVTIQDETEESQSKKVKSKSKAVKNFKLLSFGEEAEGDEEEVEEVNRKYSGKSKSTHDVLQDPKLSNVPAIEKSQKPSSESDLSGDELQTNSSNILGKEMSNIDSIKSKLKSQKSQSKKHSEDDDDEEEGYDFYKERKKEKKKQLEELRNEYKSLKQDMQQDSKKKRVEEEREQVEKGQRIKRVEEQKKNKDYFSEIDKYKEKVQQIPKKGSSREEYTASLLAKFREKLISAKEKVDSTESTEKTGQNEDEELFQHELHFESTNPVLAKDANTKDDEWFEISDPRSAINKRKREASQKLMQKFAKRTRD